MTKNQQPLTVQDIRLHALNLAVAGRKDHIRLTAIDKEEPFATFADDCIADAAKYEAYLLGELAGEL